MFRLQLLDRNNMDNFYLSEYPLSHLTVAQYGFALKLFV
jgi:hypothetical protein